MPVLPSCRGLLQGPGPPTGPSESDGDDDDDDDDEIMGTGIEPVLVRERD